MSTSTSSFSDTLALSLTGDVLTGTAESELLEGTEGNDTIDGGAGNDTLVGWWGDDSLAGGAGDDLYIIDRLTDVIVEAEGGGKDTVNVDFFSGTYALGANLENAQAGISSVWVDLTGNALDNLLVGNGWNNRLSGGAGNDTLEGAGRDDTLDGGTGFDIAVLEEEPFGFGFDYTVVRPSATQTNLVDPFGSTVILLNVEVVQWKDWMGNLIVMPIEDLLWGVGTFGDDTLVGASDRDTLRGDAGNDLLQGADGDDVLSGGTGADTLWGDGGSDVLSGGTGADTYHFGAAEGDDAIAEEGDATALVVDTLVIDAGSGNLAGGQVHLARSQGPVGDLILTTTSGNTLTVEGFFLNDAVDNSAAIEQIRFTDGNVTLSQAQILAELLKGSATADWIRGYGSNDALDGRDGDDTLEGAAGHDTLTGGLGNDALDGDSGADLLRGNEGSDTLAGWQGNDILDGGADDDLLDGLVGWDVLLGGAGNDALHGYWGRDTLVGGAGDDTLTGGMGADRFVLNTLDGIDTLTDFTPGLDKIAINKRVFSAMADAGGGAPTTLAELGEAFTYDAATGALTYDADGAGGADPLTIAQLTPGLDLAADFLIVG